MKNPCVSVPLLSWSWWCCWGNSSHVGHRHEPWSQSHLYFQSHCLHQKWPCVKILITSKSHFAIGSDPIELKALHYHYLDLPILHTSADLEYYHSHSVDFFLIILHLSDHMIISCCHPGCLTTEYTFVFIAIFSYLLCFTFLSVLKSVLLFVLVQFWYQLSSVSSSVL